MIHLLQITSISYLGTPVYYNPTTILIEAIDALTEVDTVILSYEQTSVWYHILATDTGGGVYSATIPAFDYGENIRFYITVNDTLDRTLVDDNGGSYYGYDVDDDVNPIGNLVNPVNGSIVSGDITLSVDCSDIGSGINFVQFYRGAFVKSLDNSVLTKLFIQREF